MPHLVCLNSVAIRELLSKCYKHSDIIPVRCRYGELDNGTIMVSYRDMGTIMVSLRGQETKDPLSKVYFIVSSIFITLSFIFWFQKLFRDIVQSSEWRMKI